MTDNIDVVGIDPSLTRSGVAGAAGVRTVRSEGHEDATARQRAVRLHNLCAEILDAVHAVRDGMGGDLLVVIEATSLGQGRQQGTRDRIGLWWLLVDALDGETGVDVVEVSPAQRMKYATGHGRADKDEVMAAAIRRYPAIDIRNNDVADAVILRAMGEHALGRPLAAVPKDHAAALRKVAWPDYIDIEGVLA